MKQLWSAITILAATAGIAPAQSSPGQTLTGTWACAITTSPAVAGVPPNYPGIVTFLSDGTLLGEAYTDGALDKSYGVWLRVGDKQFRSTWIGYEKDAMLKTTFPYKVFYNFSLQDDLNTLLGAFRVDVYGPDGQKVFSLGGKTKCARLVVEDFTDLP